MPVSKNFLKAKAQSPYLPWCQDEVEKLGPAVQQFIFDQESYIRRWAHRWFENFQFVFGNTSVRWSRRYDFAVDVDFLHQGGAINQRATTNISRVVCESLASLIYSNLPEWAAEAASDMSLKGKRFGIICEKLLDAYQAKLNCDREFAQAALMFVTFGQVGARVDWNPRAGTRVDIPQWRKVMKPVWTDYLTQNPITGGLLTSPTQALDTNGQPMMNQAWEAVTDQTGKQVINSILTGDLDLTMLSPFEYRREIGSHGMHKTRFVEHVLLLDYDEFLDRYDGLEGKTANFDSVQPMVHDTTMYSFAVRHFLRMQFTTPPTVSEMQGTRRTENVLKTSLFKHKILVIEHFDRPNPDMWPSGRRIVVANGQCTHVTEPQYHTNKKDGWHPFCEGQWLSLPPSSISSGPMDSVTSKNRELNVADSLIATALRRNMGSLMLYRPGGGFDPQKMSGEPGQMMPIADPDSVRYLHDAQPLPPMINPLRESYKQDVYDTSGAGDSIRGDRTKGVSAGYAFQQLQEREEKRLAPARKNFSAFAESIGEKMVSCLKANVIKLDDQTMGFMVRNAKGGFQPNDVIAFLSTPIDYGVDVKIVPSSMVAKSKATMQANLLELAKGPALMRLQQDAGVLDEFLKAFDVETLRDKSAPHRDRSNRENEIFMDMAHLGPNADGLKTPLVLLEDDDIIHLDNHINCFVQNSDEFTSNEWLFRAFSLHMETHKLQQKEKMMQAPPGTALQAPAILAAVGGHPPPTSDAIFQQVQIQAQEKARLQATMDSSQEGGVSPKQPMKSEPGKPPQSPRAPGPVGSQPTRTPQAAMAPPAPPSPGGV